MQHQFDLKQFIVRDQFKFSNKIHCKSGKYVLELVARIGKQLLLRFFSISRSIGQSFEYMLHLFDQQ